MSRKTITLETAMRKFGTEAAKRVPQHLTKDTQAMYKRMCVEGLAYQAGYYIAA
jgi:hypothetical protein